MAPTPPVANKAATITQAMMRMYNSPPCSTTQIVYTKGHSGYYGCEQEDRNSFMEPRSTEVATTPLYGVKKNVRAAIM
jgi:hypothetical protein